MCAYACQSMRVCITPRRRWRGHLAVPWECPHAAPPPNPRTLICERDDPDTDHDADGEDAENDGKERKDEEEATTQDK